jgi:hypothetical protein
MDLGVDVADVLTYGAATLAGFGAIIALAVGLRMAVGAAKKFIGR